jgi:release factor glutamine methyltransferase
MTVHEAWRWARGVLAEAGIESADAEAWWLLEASIGRSRTELVIERSRTLGAAERLDFARAVGRRTAREPIQHIVGRTAFYGIELVVDGRALVPRPETERLVEVALERVRGVASPRLLDVGTGSGAIALALKHERPDAEVAATDVDADALALARENAARLGLDVAFMLADGLDAPAAACARRADLVATNPPYLPDADRDTASPEVRHDPDRALYGGPRGTELFLRLLGQARGLLREGAWLVAELDPRNVRSARAEAETTGWAQAEITEDLAGRERFLVLRR